VSDSEVYNNMSKLKPGKSDGIDLVLIILYMQVMLCLYTICYFYSAMHFSAKRGIAIACRLSVRPSVRLSVCLSVCNVGEL